MGYKVGTIKNSQVGAQQEEQLPCRPGDLSLVPATTRKMEEETQLCRVFLTSLPVCSPHT